jgi:Domain of unknown function (DUF4262)
VVGPRGGDFDRFRPPIRQSLGAKGEFPINSQQTPIGVTARATMNEPVPRDDDDRKVLSDIRSHGWHMVGVESDEEGPGFAYSVGLLRTFGHPEILVVGLDASVMFGMINQIGELIRTGKRFEHHDESGDVLDGFNVAFRSVEARYHRDFVSYALWYYGGGDLPFLQCVWPGTHHRYPWHPEFPPSLAARQPCLSDDRSWPFHEGKNCPCFTTRRVIEGSPVLLVSHDEEGDWQFLCGTTSDSADGALVSLGSMLVRDSTLSEVAGMPEGWMAERAHAGAKWVRSRNERTDDERN